MSEDKRNNGKKKLVITMAVALILLVGVAVSYGYIAILGKNQNQEVSISTGDINLVFDDADTDSVNAKLELGQSITKTFKIENKGTKPGKVQINWKNLTNTYNSRSLGYKLETSSSKDTGYTSVEVLRENVPVSTEAKEVPLSKEITIPVGNNPIYYRVTITFNDLSDVDQSGDLKATLSTQFSLSEYNNHNSDKVLALLNTKLKTDTPDFLIPEPKIVYAIEADTEPTTYTDTNNKLADAYLYYADKYKIEPNGRMTLINPQNGKYADVYSKVQNKWVYKCTSTVRDRNEENCYKNRTSIYKYTNITSTSYDYTEYYTDDGSSSSSDGLPNIDNSLSGVYTAEDDYGKSYYYRGAVENNYFKFGGFYWRIIRVNGDGSIRLAYAGTQAHPNGEVAGSELTIGYVNISRRTAGYMIGIDETTDAVSTSKQEADTNKYDTALKAAIDGWYETSIKASTANGNADLGMYLSDTLFCSDRSVAPSANLWEEGDTALGYGNNQTVYGSYYRIKNGTPSLKCPLKNDRFTVDDETIGNGALKYKIATITGDELIMAGLTDNGNANSGKDYLHIAQYGTYTMSPSRLVPGTSTTVLSDIQRLANYIHHSNLNGHRAIPVINISSEYALKMVGSGTMTDPFMISGVN